MLLLPFHLLLARLLPPTLPCQTWSKKKKDLRTCTTAASPCCLGGTRSAHLAVWVVMSLDIPLLR